jgi:hypothetical protein
MPENSYKISVIDAIALSYGNHGALSFLGLQLLNQKQIELIKKKNLTGPALHIAWTKYAESDMNKMNKVLEELSTTGKCDRFIPRANKTINLMEYAAKYLKPPNY